MKSWFALGKGRALEAIQNQQSARKAVTERPTLGAAVHGWRPEGLPDPITCGAPVDRPHD